MKIFKLVMALAALVLVLVVGAVIYLVNNVNDIVENVVESQGTRLTQTAVTLGGVDIQLGQGRGELTDLEIANPVEFETPNALHAQKLVLQVEPASLAGDVIVIDEIAAQGVIITAEQRGITTNLQVLLDNIQQAAGSKPPAEGGGSDIRLMVEHLRFAGSSLRLVTAQYGDYELELPDLELNNIGTRARGLTPAQLGKAILEPLLEQAMDAVEERLQDEAEERLKEEVTEEVKEELGENAEEKIRNLKGLLN